MEPLRTPAGICRRRSHALSGHQARVQYGPAHSRYPATRRYSRRARSPLLPRRRNAVLFKVSPRFITIPFRRHLPILDQRATLRLTPRVRGVFFSVGLQPILSEAPSPTLAHTACGTAGINLAQPERPSGLPVRWPFARRQRTPSPDGNVPFSLAEALRVSLRIGIDDRLKGNPRASPQ